MLNSLMVCIKSIGVDSSEISKGCYMENDCSIKELKKKKSSVFSKEIKSLELKTIFQSEKVLLLALFAIFSHQPAQKLKVVTREVCGCQGAT